MRKAHLLVVVGFLLFVPFLASAHVWGVGDPLVPTYFNSSNFTPQGVQACHAVDLVSHLITFAVYISALVATIMFVYAGALYVTASARQENISQAKNIFGKVFLGFVIILTAWLIVNIILTVLTGKDINTFTDFECVAAQDRAGAPSGPSIGEATRAPTDQREDQENRALLRICGVGVNNDNACEGNQTRGCTTVAGMSARTLGYACNVGRAACPDADDPEADACEVTVTGGTEGGHAGGTNPGSHGGGDKFDLRFTEGTQTFVEDSEESGRFVPIQPPSFGFKQWQDTETGAIWTQESDHYDVCTANCGAPAARGS